MDRRKLLKTVVLTVSGWILPADRTNANPIGFILRFAFMNALRSGIRSVPRTMSLRLLGRGRGARLSAVSRGRPIRTVPRAELLEQASPRERRWTKEFLSVGLEELVMSGLDATILGEGNRIAIPEDAPVYDLNNEPLPEVDILIKNRSDSIYTTSITAYLYDIDAGIVEEKFLPLIATVRSNSTRRFSLELDRLKYTGRKVLVVKQPQVRGQVSPLIYVI